MLKRRLQNLERRLDNPPRRPDGPTPVEALTDWELAAIINPSEPAAVYRMTDSELAWIAGITDNRRE